MSDPAPGGETGGVGPVPLDRLSGASNVLLAGPTHDGTNADACVQLSSLPDSRGRTVVGVTYTRSPREWFDERADRDRERPENGVLVAVGTGDEATLPDGVDPSTWSVRTVDSPADLTGLGIQLTDAFDAFAGEDAGTTLCFDSLSVLLQYVDTKQAFKFLHVLAGRVESAGVVAHYHLDPAAHDEQTVATITGLFDAVVELDAGDDGCTVRTR